MKKKKNPRRETNIFETIPEELYIYKENSHNFYVDPNISNTKDIWEILNNSLLKNSTWSRDLSNAQRILELATKSYNNGFYADALMLYKRYKTLSPDNNLNIDDRIKEIIERFKWDIQEPEIEPSYKRRPGPELPYIKKFGENDNKESCRKYIVQWDEALENKDYQEALEKYEKAYARYPYENIKSKIEQIKKILLDKRSEQIKKMGKLSKLELRKILKTEEKKLENKKERERKLKKIEKDKKDKEGKERLRIINEALIKRQDETRKKTGTEIVNNLTNFNFSDEIKAHLNSPIKIKISDDKKEYWRLIFLWDDYMKEKKIQEALQAYKEADAYSLEHMVEGYKWLKMRIETIEKLLDRPELEQELNKLEEALEKKDLKGHNSRTKKSKKPEDNESFIGII